MQNSVVPRYPKTSSDEFFIYTSLLSPGFAGLKLSFKTQGAVTSHTPLDGCIDFCGDKGMDSGTFLAESKWVSDHSHQIIGLALSALLDQYWENRQYVLECLIDEDPNEVVPIITGPDDLKSLCDIVAVHIKEPGELGTHRFGIEFDCNWEEEHGAGVRFENLNVICEGHGSVSFDYF
jgi:hypothetical protein